MREEARSETRTNSNGETETYTRWETVHYKGFFEIIRHQVPIHNFVDGSPQLPDTTVAPFSFQIPDWVPASQMLRMRNESAELDIGFCLVT